MPERRLWKTLHDVCRVRLRFPPDDALECDAIGRMTHQRKAILTEPEVRTVTDSRLALFDDLLDFIHKNPGSQRIEEHVRALKSSALSEALSYVGPVSQGIGHRAYDQIVQAVFDGVLQATSREVLLETFLDRLDALGERSPARCLCVIETPARPDPTGPLALVGFTQRRIKVERWRNYCERTLPQLGASPFFDAIVRKRSVADLWYSGFVTQYQGELDSLFFSTVERADRHPKGYWFSAIPLPGADRYHPYRALFILYPARGTDLEPRVPSGASQEWRALSFFALAYQLLNHQLASVAEQVWAHRQEILTSLAPGIIHHEVGMQATIIRTLLNEQNLLVRRLYERCRSPDMDSLVETVAELYPAVARLYEATDAFNNLERRGAYERFALGKIFGEALAITNYRLGQAGVKVAWSKSRAGVELESDPALLLHLLVNVLVNATIAFQQGAHDWRRPSSKLLSIQVETDCPQRVGDWVRLDLCNNGPPIPDADLERIFERGFTSHPGGHGYGLYICRLIAHYLGGALRALARSELPERWNVGFRLEIPRAMPRLADMETDRRKKNGK